MSDETKEILLVDVSAFYAAAWHSTNPDEEADAPARATVRRVRHLASRYQHVAVCVDAPRSFRHDMHPGYKQNRAEKPEGYRQQLRNALHVLTQDGFPMWRFDGCEADDVIASATKLARAAGHKVTIATGDKDLFQLIDAGVCVLQTKWDKATNAPVDIVYGADECRERYGVWPTQIGDWIALMGDTSDNIPGVPGIGEKTAAKLLADHTNLLGVIDAARAKRDEHAAALAAGQKSTLPKAVESILANEQQLTLVCRLVALKDDLEINVAAAFERREPKALKKPAEPVPKEEQSMTVSDGDFEPANDPKPGVLTGRDDERYSNENDAVDALNRQNGHAAPSVEAVPEPQQTAAIQKKNDGPPQADALARVLIPGTNEWSMALEPNSLARAQWFALQVYESRVFPGFPTPQSAMMAIIQGRELGIPALAALRGTHVLKEGKLAMAAQMIIGLVLKSKLHTFFKCTERTAKQSTWKGHRKGDPDPEPTIVTYTIGDASLAGLTGGNWQKRPTEMLAKTAGVQLARLLFPDIVGGLYSIEELGELGDESEAA